MSVLEMALEMGITSDAVQKWVYDPIQEADEKDAEEVS